MTDVCVVGLGKIGLPLACAIARAGHRVRGADISKSVVDQVNAAVEPFPGEAGLADVLRETVDAGLLSATVHTTEAVRECTVVIVVVPLVVDDDAKPDFRALDAATDAVAEGLRPGALVSYETTLPVGTTRTRFAAALAKGSGLTIGEDLFVVHSPERVFSGRIFADLRRYPKLIGGVESQSAQRGVEFYESFLEFDDRSDLSQPNGVWDLGPVEAAELAKLAETTYRDINIAYANELATAAEGLGVDILPVIEACNSQPYSHIHMPGISVGGHCIPVYPHFLMDSVSGVELPAVARRVNDSMPGRAVRSLKREVGSLEGARVLILGLAYRAGVKEEAFSGAFALSSELRSAGAIVLLHDPMYGAHELERLGFLGWRPGEPASCAIVHTAHPEYRSLSAKDLPGLLAIYDGRRFLADDQWTTTPILGPGRPVRSGTSSA